MLFGRCKAFFNWRKNIRNFQVLLVVIHPLILQFHNNIVHCFFSFFLKMHFCFLGSDDSDHVIMLGNNSRGNIISVNLMLIFTQSIAYITHKVFSVHQFTVHLFSNSIIVISVFSHIFVFCTHTLTHKIYQSFRSHTTRRITLLLEEKMMIIFIPSKSIPLWLHT